MDNRVLALEVAEKHDQILKLKAEVNQLEENLRQANMQTHFKDDVIKELRRECRNLLVRKKSRDVITMNDKKLLSCLQSPHGTDTKRSISVCAMPKSGNDLEVPPTEAEQLREKKTNAHNTFLNELGVLVDVLDHTVSSCNDPLEKRIIDGVKSLKEKWLKVQEDYDVLRNNNQELEVKFGLLLTGNGTLSMAADREGDSRNGRYISDNMELNRNNQTTKHERQRKLETLRTHLHNLRQTVRRDVRGACEAEPQIGHPI